MKSSNLVAHDMIALAAMEFAAEVYEEMAKDNAWYKHNQSHEVFVKKNYARFIPQVRMTFASMLGRKDIAESLKESIHEALQLDRVLPDNQRHGIEEIAELPAFATGGIYQA